METKNREIFEAMRHSEISKCRESELKKIKQRLTEFADGIEIPEYHTNGWFVLLKHDNNSRSGYEFVGFYNPDLNDEEPEWDTAMPIQTNIPEFLGW